MRAKGTKIKQPQICPQPDSTTSRTYAKKASAVMATMDDTVDLTKSSDDERGQRGEEVPFDSRGDGRASIKAASYPAKRPKLVELDRNVLMSSAAPRAPMPVDSASSGSDSDSAGPSCREKGSTSKQQRTLFLASIGNLSDRTLQQMLFNRRFFFRLIPHQFAAVRFVAGVPYDYPTITDKANGALKVMNFPAPQTHGAILADQMGLNLVAARRILLPST